MDGPHLKDGKVRLYKRAESKKWQARIRLSNGVWKRITTGESDLELASRIACDKYEEYRVLKKMKIIFESRRFKDVARIAITEMQKELESGYGKKSFIDSIQALNRYFIPYFGNTFINNIDFKALKEFDQWREQKVGKKLKHSTLNNHNFALRRVFKVGMDRNWIHSYQVPELKNNGEKGKHRAYFTVQEYLKMDRFMRNWSKTGRTEKVQIMRELLRDYVSILINTGMRHGTETYNLKWKHIETIEHNGQSFIRIWVSGKTGERELIARQSVRRHLERIRARFGVVDGEVYVFRLRNGERTKYLDGTFQNLLNIMGLLKGRQEKARILYSLRHTYATVQIIAGIDYHKLAKNMGTSIAILERHYSHLTPTLAAKELS